MNSFCRIAAAIATISHTILLVVVNSAAQELRVQKVIPIQQLQVNKISELKKDWTPALSYEELEKKINPVLPQVEIRGFRFNLKFDWEMLPRFGSLDANSNNLPDLPNSFEYVQNLSSDYCKTHSCQEIIPTFQVVFDASGSTVRSIGNTSFRLANLRKLYSWQIVAANTNTPIGTITADKRWATKLPEGIYDVKLTLIISESVQQLASGPIPVGIVAQDSLTTRIRIEDIVIVSIGDSFSSGEGNPERYRLQYNNQFAKWADDGLIGDAGLNSQKHQRAHRSTLAWPAQTALAIEQADSRSSVTFVSTATTGAMLREGITTGRGADNEPMPLGGLPNQLDEVKSLLGNRQIDLLFVSAGINDAGFKDVLTSFLMAGQSKGFVKDLGSTESFADASETNRRNAVVQAALSGNWSNVFKASAEPCTNCIGINRIRQGYADLALELQNRFRKQLGEVHVVGYPDPTGYLDSKGELYWCDHILEDIVGQRGGMMSSIADLFAEDIEINADEQIVLVEQILQPLNNAISLGAFDAGWQFSSTDIEFANGHGYCADWPNFHPGTTYYFGLGNPYPQPVPPSDATTQWFRRANQSSVLQGPTGAIICDYGIFCLRAAIHTRGTMHPNELGHQAIAKKVLSSVVLPVEIANIGTYDADDQLKEAVNCIRQGTIYGAIFPRTDVDIVRIQGTIGSKSTQLSGPELPKVVRPEAVVQPGLIVTLGVIGNWSPRLRLYDETGKILSENSVVADGFARITYWYPAGCAPVIFAAISAAENDNYDPITGTGGCGGKGGSYTLTVRETFRGNSQVRQ